MGLKTRKNGRETSITKIFKNTKETGAEKDHSVTELVFFVVNIKGAHKFFTSLLVIHEGTFWEDRWVQDSVTLLDISIWHTIWETKTTNTDTFKHTVTTKLMQDDVGDPH